MTAYALYMSFATAFLGKPRATYIQPVTSEPTLSTAKYILEPHPSNNVNERIRFIIIHGTALNLEKSLSYLDGSEEKQNKDYIPVSAHLLISDKMNDKQQTIIYQLVDETKRAWHAGVSFFQKRAQLNDTSLGIEVVNEAEEVEWIEDGVPIKCIRFPAFHVHQLSALADLISNLSQKYAIAPTCITTHVAVAPDRKSDPGPGVMKALHANYNIGAWYDENEVAKHRDQLNQMGLLKYPDIKWAQQNLKAYGFEIDITGELDLRTKQVLRAFMMDFRPEKYPGRIAEDRCTIPEDLTSTVFMRTLYASLDSEFYAILDSLVRSYVSQEALQEQDIVSLQDYLEAQHSTSTTTKS